MDFIAWLIDFRVVIGAVFGAIIMFFVAQKNPEWVQSTYQKQRKLSMDGTEEVDRLKKQVAEMELEKKIEAKIAELQAKIKG